MRRRGWGLRILGIVALACSPAPKSVVTASPAPSAPPRLAPSVKLPTEPAAEPADAAQIWARAVSGDVAGARRSLVWFRQHPPEKTYAGPEYRPRVVCSEDAARCAYPLTYPAGTGVTDGSGKPLRVIDHSHGGPFTFVGETHLLYMSGQPGGVVDADSGEPKLELPDAAWSTIDIGEKYIVFALDSVKTEQEVEPSEAGDAEGAQGQQWVGVWDVVSRRMLFEKRSNLGEHPSPFLSADGSFVLASTDTAAYAWTLSDGELVAATAQPGVGSPVAAHGDNIAIVSYGKAGAETRLIDRAGKIVARSRACANARAVQFSPTGKLLAVGGDRRACVLRVPSLAPIFRSVALPKAADEWGMPNEATFFDEERVVAFGTPSAETALYEIAGPKRRFAAGKAEVRATRTGEIAIIDRTAKTLLILRDLAEQSRRALSPEEALDPDRIPELGVAREPARGEKVADRIRAGLCMVHGHAFPGELCE
jgi:hypothetical protein